MNDVFLGPWQTIVLAPRGGKIACVFDDPYDQFEWESGIWSARYPDADDMKHLYYPVY